MTQTCPATCVLGPGKTGLTIGLRVLNLDGTVYAAFSAVGVAETSTAGTYRKAGGVVAPLAGGYIVWGTALVDYAEATVESASVNVTHQGGAAVVPTATPGVIYASAVEVLQPVSVNAISLRTAIGLATANLDTQLAAIAADVATIDNSGTYSYSNTVDDGSNLLDGVYIQLATDSGFTNIVTITHSNASGAFTVRSDTAGAHYLRLQLAGYEFSDQTVTLA